MDVNPGAFDEVVDLYSYALTRGSEGQKIETYVHSGRVFANVKFTDSDELSSDNAISKRSATAIMYKRSGMDTKWQVEWKGKRYTVANIEADERISHYMTVTMTEL